MRRVIGPGDMVLDIGTGIGATAVLACRCGAGRVFAIEPSSAIEHGRSIAASNGCADRIEFMRGLSTEMELPQRVDVIVSDLRGVLPLMGHHIPSIIDARTRHLVAGGTLIPAEDSIWLAVVEAAETYEGIVRPWSQSTRDLDLSSVRAFVVNDWIKARFDRSALLTEAACWGSLDYRTVTTPHLSGRLELVVSRPGTAHGIAAWFDTTLSDGIGFSNAPGEPAAIYSHGFFPFTDPVTVSEGDVIRLDIRANLVGDDYVWSWNTDVVSPGSAQPRVSFRQSTVAAAPLDMREVRKAADNHIPTLSGDGAIDGFVLGLMDGSRSVGDIAKELYERHPERFPRWQDALKRVGTLSRTYSK